MPIPEHEPLPATTPPHPSPPTTTTPAPPPGKWGPYSDAADFTANVATILVALFCALLLAVAANAVVRHFLLRRRRRDTGLPVSGSAKEAAAARGAFTGDPAPPPVLVFSRRGTTTLAGDGRPECAICLSEFHDGDHVRVIPACNHGFHVNCVDTWLAARPSCPTCRSTCNDAHRMTTSSTEPVSRSGDVEDQDQP